MTNRKLMDFREVAKFIDVMFLDPNLTEEETLVLCRKAITYEVGSVIVKPCYVSQAVIELKRTGVSVGTVIGFPFGVNTGYVKLEETKRALTEGAKELELIINWGYLQENDNDKIRKDIEPICGLAHMNLALTKVVIECSQLTKDQIVLIAKIAVDSGADFVFPTNGYWTGNTNLADIQLIHKSVGHSVQVKAAGDIRSISDFSTYRDAGCARIGIIDLNGILLSHMP